jgi:hypothetical protein
MSLDHCPGSMDITDRPLFIEYQRMSNVLCLYSLTESS